MTVAEMTKMYVDEENVYRDTTTLKKSSGHRKRCSQMLHCLKYIFAAILLSLFIFFTYIAVESRNDENRAINVTLFRNIFQNSSGDAMLNNSIPHLMNYFDLLLKDLASRLELHLEERIKYFKPDYFQVFERTVEEDLKSLKTNSLNNFKLSNSQFTYIQTRIQSVEFAIGNFTTMMQNIVDQMNFDKLATASAPTTLP